MPYHSEEPISLECTDALDEEGYCLTLASTGKVAKSTAGQAVFGVAVKSTVNYATLVAEADKQVAVVQAPRYARVQYHTPIGSGSIAIGDIVSMKAGAVAGRVQLHAATPIPGTYSSVTAETIADEEASIVGIAMEAITMSGSVITHGTMKVKLLCPLLGHI